MNDVHEDDELQGAIGDAIRTLRGVANDSKQDTEDRVAAATAILDFATGMASACPPEHGEGWMSEEWEEEGEGEE
ncbi:MAG: hypothetical protein GX774_13395 [Armatimonadetes bacterium]|jgi:hypothetical protein|nr:hypothetical protein [Armatimonadota bacterium]